jgi:hypothetical protein
MPAAKGARQSIWSWEVARVGDSRLPNRRVNAGEIIRMREMLYSSPESFVAGIFSVLLIEAHLLGVRSLMPG